MIKDLKTNQAITANRILLIDDEGVSQGEVSYDQAMYLAYEKGFDLVLINENAKPPIAKLMDYGKYLYSQEKQSAKQKAQVHSTETKEVRLGIKIDDHDLEVKTNQIKKFLEKGHRVKISIQLRGREMIFKDKVSDLLEKVRTLSSANFEKPVDRMGNRFFAVLIRSRSNNNQ